MQSMQSSRPWSRASARVALAAIWPAAISLAACGDGPPGSVATSASAAVSSSAAPATGTPGSASQAGASQAGAAPADAGPEGTTSALRGTWKGGYRAEKVTPTLDPTVVDAVWKGDDGKRHAGPGAIELTVDADGSVTGTITGALAGRIHGVTDEGTIRASLSSPAEDGPNGTLIGKRDGEGVAFEVRTSDGAGKAPRLARGTLERGP